MNPIVHFLEEGSGSGLQALPVLGGGRPVRRSARTVLVCTHLVGERPFGAERSLLDVLRALERMGLNVLVSAPWVRPGGYLEALREASCGVWVLPYRWWRRGRPACAETVQHFAAFIRERRVSAVLMNTIVLDEPGVAARQCGVPVIVHARELPEHDEELSRVLGADAVAIREHALALADRVIVNSGAVERFFAAPGRTALVPDCLDPTGFDLAAPSLADSPRVGLISSNLPKKGLGDFVELARLLSARAPQLSCVLVGPDNEHVAALRATGPKGELPGNLVFAGYAGTPQEAIAQVDLVLNLSHVEESFGRTVLEAMMGRRPVVCYDRGGLGDLVVEGETGYLVPFGDVAAVAERVCRIFADPDLCRRLGEAGRERAIREFGPEQFQARLARALDGFI